MSDLDSSCHEDGNTYCKGNSSINLGRLNIESSQNIESPYFDQFFFNHAAQKENTSKIFACKTFFLEFKDPLTELRYRRFFVSQHSWRDSLWLVVLPISACAAEYTYALINRSPTDISNMEVGFLLIAFLFVPIFAIVYTFMLKSLNDKCSINNIADAEAIGLTLLRSRDDFSWGLPVDDSSEENDLYIIPKFSNLDKEYDSAYKTNSKVYLIDEIDAKVNSILWTSLILSLLYIALLLGFGLYRMSSLKCSYFCINHQIPALPLLLIMLTPMQLSLTLPLTWRSLMICELVIRSGIICFYFFMTQSKTGGLTNTPNYAFIVIGMWGSFFALEWSMHYRYIGLFCHCERLALCAVKNEREFSARNAIWLIQ